MIPPIIINQQQPPSPFPQYTPQYESINNNTNREN